ncbi:MAG TPA: GTPase, partial [Longimicrobium sp.]
VSELRDAVIGTEALIAYSIDFPEEDEPPIPPARIVASATDVIARIDALLATAPEGELLREGALTVLAGRPNSGKSSLFNALLGTERAIVTEIPGTTRDAVEASASIDGYPFRLVDTAGLRETADRVEGIGIEVARRYLSAADLVLFCIESGRTVDDDERAFMADVDPARLVVVRTMSDRHPGGSVDADPSIPTVTLSAATGDGMPELRHALLVKAFGGILGEPGEAPLVTRERHARALRAARDELTAFLAAMDDAVPMEFAATHLRAAVGALEDLVGVVSVDDVLDRVFGTFCVGK